MAKTTWGRKETIIWPQQRPIYTYGAIFVAIVLTVVFVYARLRFVGTPLQRYYMPIYARTSVFGSFSRTHSIETSLAPSHAILADEIGNEVYASHYSERKTYRLILACGTVLLCGSMWLNFALARRPLVNRYIRIDEMGRAQAIQYSDLNYSPREGEIRTYLTDWANYRYTISRDTIAKKYPLNYYFLSGNLASQLMTEDNQNHLVSQVVGGQIEQSDVEVKNVTITSMSQETIQGVVMARGTALLALDRLYSPSHSREPRTEHWILSLTYYLNPKQVSDQAKIYPQYEFINPLGLTITEFHENRVSVDPIAPGAATTTTDGAVR